MPDTVFSSMKLSQEKLQKYLSNKQIKGTCTFCGIGEYAVNGADLCALVSIKGGKIDTSFGMPVLPFVCQNCGHIEFVNCVNADLFDAPDKEAGKHE